jgi:transcriptional regulator with XRE-family HTH domain
MQKLVRARRRAKLSGYAVAKEAKIDRSYYRYIELGKYVPSPDVATRIAEAINKLSGSDVITASEIVFGNYQRRVKAKASAA